MSQLILVEYSTKNQASMATFRAILGGRRSAMEDGGLKEFKVYVNQDDPNNLVTLQKWVSREHQSRYVEWARAQPDNDEFQGCWASPPRVTVLGNVDG